MFYDRGVPKIADLAETTDFTTEAKNGKPGLTLEIFHNHDLSGQPASVSVAKNINVTGINWDLMNSDPAMVAALFPPGSKASRRYAGYYTAPSDGRYILALESSGEGSNNRVFVDGKQVIDDWDLVRAFQPHVTLVLSAGAHKVVVEERQDFAVGGKLRVAIVPEEKIVSERAKELAAKADVVVVAAGFDPDSEGEGGDRTFALPYGQDELIQAMAAANKKVIVAVTSGGNVDSNAWLDRVPALLETWYAGQEEGKALAEILLGEVNPSGHLPATFERQRRRQPFLRELLSGAGHQARRLQGGHLHWLSRL